MTSPHPAAPASDVTAELFHARGAPSSSHASGGSAKAMITILPAVRRLAPPMPSPRGADSITRPAANAKPVSTQVAGRASPLANRADTVSAARPARRSARAALCRPRRPTPRV